MASLYPSLEDMKVDHMVQAQRHHENQHQQVASAPAGYAGTVHRSSPMEEAQALTLYPSLNDYMGLNLNQISIPSAVGHQSNVVAPVTYGNLGYARGQVNHGVREVIFCKDGNGKVGLRLESVNKGVFVILVEKNSPAALVGLRFGDQVLSINEEYVAGYTLRQVHEVIRKAKGERITMAVRDRPFERTVTMVKDSFGNCGFDFRNGRVTTLVKDSSAVRNGLLTEHQLLEVNGQNVVQMKDSFVKDLIRASSGSITVTIMPSVIYDHLVKYTAGSMLKKLMDHSVPDI